MSKLFYKCEFSEVFGMNKQLVRMVWVYCKNGRFKRSEKVIV